jgi:hypothetical protein
VHVARSQGAPLDITELVENEQGMVTEVMQTIIGTLHFRIAHEDITVYNPVQKLLYIIRAARAASGSSESSTRRSQPPRVQYAGRQSRAGRQCWHTWAAAIFAGVRAAAKAVFSQGGPEASLGARSR